MKTTKTLLLILVIAVVAFVGGYYGSRKQYEKLLTLNQFQKATSVNNYAIKTNYQNNLSAIQDFSYAAEIGTKAVVNIKTEYFSGSTEDLLFDLLFGNPYRSLPIEGTGSGVIISKDGYIVTNNHVIDKANTIKVTLSDKREFKAEVIGTDPNTDLAVIKIEANDLTPIIFGNSNNVKIGQWVIAVGNPFGLNSTVTAGIVSAKSRNISILKNKYAIESFIQTDAAVNPGNSGGALLDGNGYLIGINTAIASPTGAYAGYAFAIPSNLVKKVVADIIEFGKVQRAYLGVTVAEVNNNTAKTYNLKSLKGVVITSIAENSPAYKIGLKEGDVILKIDSIEVNSVSELLEIIGQHRPKDKVELTISKNNTITQVKVELSNFESSTPVVSSLSYFGATFEDVPKEELLSYGLKNGVRVAEVSTGKFMSVGIRKGFIIISINNKPVNSAKEVVSILEKIKGGVYIEGYYPQTDEKAYYAFGVK